MFKQSTSFPANFQPGPHDVICAKSNSAFQHVGNRRFRLLLEFHAKAYQAAKTKAGKKEVFLSIFTAIQSSNGRFIRKSRQDGGWESLGTVQVREKIGHGLRHASSRGAGAKQSCVYDIIGEKPKAVSLQRMTSGDGSVSSVHQNSSEDPPNKVYSRHAGESLLAVAPVAATTTMEPLPLECTSGFDENLESSLVGMLLSPSLRKSFRKTARRCSNVAMSMLFHSTTQTANDDLLESSSLVGNNNQRDQDSDNLHPAVASNNEEEEAHHSPGETDHEPLAITSSSDFHHRSSLVGMLLSPSFFSESVKSTARRCSTALTSMLRGNSILKTQPEDDDQLNHPDAALFLDDLDGDVFSNGDDDLLSTELFEDILALDEQ